jgi:hypothetical protein
MADDAKGMPSLIRRNSAAGPLGERSLDNVRAFFALQ